MQELGSTYHNIQIFLNRTRHLIVFYGLVCIGHFCVYFGSLSRTSNSKINLLKMVVISTTMRRHISGSLPIHVAVISSRFGLTSFSDVCVFSIYSFSIGQ